MSAFTDQVEHDLSAVFLPLNGGRPAEFDQALDIDGRTVLAMLLPDERTPFSAEGVYLSTSVLYCREIDLPSAPVITQRMVIDGRKGNVVHVDGDMGLLIVRLEWFES